MCHKKRSFTLRFCYVFLVVIALSLVFARGSDAGCAGDCFTCHPKLKNNETHKSMGTCASCHNGSLMTYSLMPKTNVNGGCGTKCFQCHNEFPLDSYHVDLTKCIKCHQSGRD